MPHRFKYRIYQRLLEKSGFFIYVPSRTLQYVIIRAFYPLFLAVVKFLQVRRTFSPFSRGWGLLAILYSIVGFNRYALRVFILLNINFHSDQHFSLPDFFPNLILLFVTEQRGKFRSLGIFYGLPLALSRHGKTFMVEPFNLFSTR